MAIKDLSLTPATPFERAFSLLDMEPSQLITLRHEIDKILGIGSLGDLNVESEIMVQLATAKALQVETLTEKDTPANQKAQTINAVGAILRDLVRMQTELYNAERIKEVEAAVIDCMRLAPDDVKDKFFERYERLLTKEAT